MAQPGQGRTRLLAIITTILAVAALKQGKAVLLPLVTALFAIVLVWPVYAAVERRAPRAVALLAAVMVIFSVGAVFAGALVISGNQIAAQWPQITERLKELSGTLQAWGQRYGLPLQDPLSGQAEDQERLSRFLSTLLQRMLMVLGLLSLVLAFLLLGLLEVRDYQAKIRERLRAHPARTLLDLTVRIAAKVRRYMVALTLSSAVSGVLTGIYALVMGLDLALLWGLLAFLLNYIPTVGPFIAVVPPTLFALLQAKGVGHVLAVLIGIGAIQFLVGNFIDPKIEGRALSLSPLVVLFAIVFWGWVWGVLGALLAVPITAAVIIVCQHFEQTRWIALLLSEASKKKQGQIGPQV